MTRLIRPALHLFALARAILAALLALIVGVSAGLTLGAMWS